MPNLFIEQQTDGTYAVKEGTRTIATGATQEEAIQKAHERGPGVKLDIERVRNTEAGGRDQWRSE